ncbi:MAG: aldo/keto reductase, partial [Phycisphaerales bacterium]
QGNDIVPIPGTKKLKYLEENIAAANLTLTADELKEIDKAFPVGLAAGTRYAERAMAALNG